MPLLEKFLCVLTVIVIIVLIVLTVYSVKFLKELTKTLTSVRNLTEMTQNELKPALASINEVLSLMQKVSKSADNHITTVRNVVTALFGAYCVSLANAKTKGAGFIKGLISGFNIFGKKRR